MKMGQAGLLAWVFQAALVAPAALPPGQYGFRTFPPPAGASLGFAEGFLSDEQGGMYVFVAGRLLHFRDGVFHPMGPGQGLPDAPLFGLGALPGKRQVLIYERQVFLGEQGTFRPLPGLPDPDTLVAPTFLIRALGLALPLPDGLLVLDGTGRQRLPLPPLPAVVDALRDPDGRIHLLGTRHLLRLEHGQWRQLPLPALRGDPSYLLRDRLGNLWIRSTADLVRLDPSGRAHRGPWQLGISPFPYLWEDPWGRLWTQTQEGLVCLDGDRVLPLEPGEGLPGSHPGRPFAFDDGGGLWTLSDEGLHHLQGGFRWTFHGRRQGLSHPVVWALARSEPSNRLHAGTLDGLFRLTQDRWTRVPGTEGWQIALMASLGEDRLLAVGKRPRQPTYDFLLVGPQGAPRILPLHPGSGPQPMPTAMAPDGPGGALVILGSQVLRVSLADGRLVSHTQSLPDRDPSEPLTWIARGPGGRLWVGGPRHVWVDQAPGWFRLGPAQGLASTPMTGAFPGPGDEMWVVHGATPPRITRLVPSAQGWAVAGLLEGPTLGTTRELLGGLTDRQGRTWLVSDGHLVRREPGGTQAYDKAWGLPSTTFAHHVIHEDEAGRIWLPTTNGLALFDPRFDRPQPAPPTVAITEALDRRGQPLQPGAKLPHHAGEVAFTFHLPLQEGSENLQVQARLQGHPEEWQPVIANRVRFPRLRGGRYQLEVRAVTPDGRSGPLTTFPFQVRLPWYLLWWVHLLAGATFVTGTAAFLRWRTWALARDKARLETEVQRATEELRQSHDELVQALAEVRTLSGFIPICATCKKIRNDEGYWAQIEHYLAEHTDARFSHGMCPQCAEDFRAEWKRERERNPEGGA